ncbi:MAG TPA: hypothetical protein VE890_14815, partial [Thermoguttaceae bacterium]|nr:hypothetical protein [Thermoguttaceae bacterium]
MRIRLRLWQLAVLASIVSGPIVQQGFAQSDQRSVVVGRQRVQADLTAAIADGRLTRVEQYDILLTARDSLSEPDLLILQHTLDRLSEKYEAPSRSLREELAQRIGRKVESGDQTISVRTTRAGSIDTRDTDARNAAARNTAAKDSNPTEMVAYEQPAESLGDSDDATSADSPFHEEGMLPTVAPGGANGEVYFDDPTLAFESCGPWVGGGELALLAHPFVLVQC